MGLRVRSIGFIGVLALVGGLLTACQPQPQVTVTVNTAADGADARPGDKVCEVRSGQGDCTLRAAIQETNAVTSSDVIRLPTGLDPAATTPLPAITSPLTVLGVGAGAGATLHVHLTHTAGALSLQHLTITGVHQTSGCGGAVTSTGTSIGLIDVRITANTTGADHGGGICASGSLALVNSTVADNRETGTTSASGGGIYATGDVTILASTLSQNASTSQTGDEVAMSGAHRLTIVQSTLSDGPAGTSLLYAPNATGSITHATIDGNAQLPPSVTVSGSSMAYCASSGGWTSGGYNQFAAACSSAVATDQIGPAQLAPLDDNGGPTATRLPSAISPLLDAIPAGTAGLCDSSAGAVDQRGLPRRAHGRCDIGSVELQSGLRAAAPVPPGPPAGAQGRAVAVNETGVVAGSGWPINPPALGPDQATRWAANGTRTNLGTLGGSDARALGINASGVIVGWSRTASGASHAFRYDPVAQAMVDLGTLAGDTSSQATSVNTRGTIVGSSTSASGETHAVAWDASTRAIRALTDLGGASSSAAAVNDNDVAVGRSDRASGPAHAARWDLRTGAVLDLGTVPGGSDSYALGINAAGTIVGSVARPDLPDPCLPLGYPTGCLATSAFTWTSAAGIRVIPGKPAPQMSAVDVDDNGRVLLAATTVVLACSHCPNSNTQAYVVDPATGERVLLAPAQLVPAALSNAGKVVGTGRYVDPGGFVYFDTPFQVITTTVP